MQEEVALRSDEDLATLLAETNDQAAWDEMYRRYRKRVYLWCFRYTHDVDEAVDCAQEVFVRIFRGLGSYEHGARLSTWIYQIARNYCLGQMARRSRQWRERLAPLDHVDVVDSAWNAQRRGFEHQDSLRRLLDRAGPLMEPQELEAFVLHYGEGLSVKEITRMLECKNLSGARTLIQNARRKFRRLVLREEFTDE